MYTKCFLLSVLLCVEPGALKKPKKTTAALFIIFICLENETEELAITAIKGRKI